MTSTPLIEPDSLAVQTHGLGKRFGTRAALDGVDLEVPRGCAFGFLGANGAGKTTLIRLLLGLAEPTAGRMRVLGDDLPGGRVAALARVGAIIEEPRFHPHLTGRENLDVHAAARERGASERIDGALARVGLAARAGDRVKSYSLGMRQRLGVARCLLADPELLILDEPMNGLDPAGILEFRRLIRELVGEGRTVLLSSHLLDEVEKTCDVAAIVDQGRVVAQGTIHGLVRGGPRAIDIVCHTPAEAASLLAAVPGVTRASDHEGSLRVTLSPEAPVDREIVTALRPARLLPGDPAAAARDELPGDGAPADPRGRPQPNRRSAVTGRRPARRACHRDRRGNRVVGGSARTWRMAHQDPRDLVVDGTRGRGYAQRVSLALPAWVGNPSSRLVDATVTVAVGVPVVATTIADAAADDRPLLGVLFGLAAVAPLLVRRRWPFAALAAILAVAFSSPADGAFELPVLVAVFTIGLSRSWEATVAAAMAVVGAAAVYEVAGGPDLSREDVLGLALLCSIAAGAGLYIGSRRTSIEALRERAERLDRERELLAERAVAEERVRIAQELHDVVAHNVSLIVVQAQALGATVADVRVTEATTGIADLGRQAMAEMHRTLKLLRANEDEAAVRGPQPGLGDLDELLERARAAGLRVELAVEGEPQPLSQSADLSAYRIVQEALTNVVRHAGRADTTVTLSYRAEALELTIADRGDAALSASAGAGNAGGHGLIGMRERAALFGGTLTAGPRGDRGFEVRALLPYDEANPT